MRTSFVTAPPIEIQDWLAQRRAWEGEDHVTPTHHAAGTRGSRRGGRACSAPLATSAGLTDSGPCSIGHEPDARCVDRLALAEQVMVTGGDESPRGEAISCPRPT